MQSKQAEPNQHQVLLKYKALQGPWRKNIFKKYWLHVNIFSNLLTSFQKHL